MKKLWNWFWNGTSKVTFAAMVFFGGVVVWGGFNTAMEATNSLEFCISCHEMRDYVYAEYKETIHYKNQHGVRTVCADCHVPDNWGGKVVRKIKASKELYYWMTGKINSPEKFETHRLALAQNVWREMKENNSRECRNCHAYTAMHWEKQTNRGKKWMQEAEKTDMACVECHKGVAHKLPNMEKAYAELTTAVMSDAGNLSSGGTAQSINDAQILVEAKEGAGKVADLSPLTKVSVLETQGDWAKVRLSAWDREGGTKLFGTAGQPMQVAKLGIDGLDLAKAQESFVDEETTLEWHRVEVDGWVLASQLTSEADDLEAYAKKLYELDCNLCHQLHPTKRFNAFDWEREIKAMRRYTKLDQVQQQVVLKYLQSNAKDAAQ